jgi:hypothetical protein
MADDSRKRIRQAGSRSLDDPTYDSKTVRYIRRNFYSKELCQTGTKCHLKLRGQNLAHAFKRNFAKYRDRVV